MQLIISYSKRKVNSVIDRAIETRHIIQWRWEWGIFVLGKKEWNEREDELCTKKYVLLSISAFLRKQGRLVDSKTK